MGRVEIAIRLLRSGRSDEEAVARSGLSYLEVLELRASAAAAPRPHRNQRPVQACAAPFHGPAAPRVQTDGGLETT